MEEDLEEDIAELFADEWVIFVAEGFVELVGLFEEVGAKRLVGLGGVPFAAAAEVVHERERLVE
jgi:hypothetical protein